MPEFEDLFVNYIATLWGFISFNNESFDVDLQQELSKISSGSFIAEIIDRLKLKIQCQQNANQTIECERMKNQKFYGYSGHDITEISLLLGLGYETFIFEKHSMPSVSSSIVLELWESEEAENAVITEKNQFEYYYVKIYYYQNSTVESPKNIGNLLPKCQGKGCPISYLIKRAELLCPKPDLKSYCNQAMTSDTFKLNNSLTTLLFISFSLFYLFK
uniref:2-phosphoxylose phosphatase 1 n=1 Tax=Panagrolaimus superbus TaxID=310955 RepID=A0A914YTE1_9BILA